MIGSEYSRVLSERCGIFDFRQQAGMHGFLDSVVRHRGMEPEAAIDYIVARWEEYLRSTPRLTWTWGSAYTFFLSGRWDVPDSWPWRDGQRPHYMTPEEMEREKNYAESKRLADEHNAAWSRGELPSQRGRIM